MAHPGGRPREIDIVDMIAALDRYVENTKEPFIQEFCLEYRISRDRFYDYVKEYSELSDIHKRLLAKQELYILKHAGKKGGIHPVFAMFRLQQPTFGYQNRSDLQINAQIEAIPVNEAQLEAQICRLLEKHNAIDILPEAKPLLEGGGGE